MDNIKQMEFVKLKSTVIFMKLDNEAFLFDIRNKKGYLLNETASNICQKIRSKYLSIQEIGAMFRRIYNSSNNKKIENDIFRLVKQLYGEGLLIFKNV